MRRSLVLRSFYLKKLKLLIKNEFNKNSMQELISNNAEKKAIKSYEYSL